MLREIAADMEEHLRKRWIGAEKFCLYRGIISKRKFYGWMNEWLPRVRILEEFACRRDDEEPYLRITENGKLLSFLYQAYPPLWERYFPAARVLDPPYVNLSPPHGSKSSSNSRFLWLISQILNYFLSLQETTKKKQKILTRNHYPSYADPSPFPSSSLRDQWRILGGHH